MSKYIRTENGVYDTSKGIYTPSIKMYAIGTETIYEKDIINQADTIEELVDEFVWDKSIIRFEAGSKKYFSYENDDFDFELNESILKEGIYGAIWIVGDNGAPILKSVSRMINMEGELELL